MRNIHKINQRIYITSDEEIKEWYIYEGKLLKISVNHSKYEMLYGKPIIITTDPELKIQLIDDEFLEWFAKNPNCENVEVISFDKYSEFSGEIGYEIVIPKEEVKQHFYCSDRLELDDIEKCTIQCDVCSGKLKQETLEEAAENYTNNGMIKVAFMNGAFWQQERSYSEEEVHDIIKSYQDDMENNSMYQNYDEWFEQFKKQVK